MTGAIRRLGALARPIPRLLAVNCFAGRSSTPLRLAITLVADESEKHRMAKCPKCESPVSNITISATTLKGAGMKTLNGIVYSCPSCSSILSVAIDPLAVAADTADNVAQKLRGKF
jgi:hypothetical protein